MTRYEQIADNYKRVTEKIEEARLRRGGGSVTLLGATKTVPADEIIFAADELGLKTIGENRAQELCEKYDAVAPHCDVQFIGSLQTNKINSIIGKVSLIHSVGSLHLAEAISKKAAALGRTADILAEINIASEDAKSGFLPDEAEEMIARLCETDALRLRGIMTMAPAKASENELRKYFRKTYQIFIDILLKKSHNIIDPVLSMGMSDSYELAIEEGATMVRIGSAIFGHRQY